MRWAQRQILPSEQNGQIYQNIFTYKLLLLVKSHDCRLEKDYVTRGNKRYYLQNLNKDAFEKKPFLDWVKQKKKTDLFSRVKQISGERENISSLFNHLFIFLHQF